jgi:tight adherence protein B
VPPLTISSVVPTVAASVDIVVHVASDGAGHRRVREIVGVPGRVERDVIRPPISSRRGPDISSAPTVIRRILSGSRRPASTSSRRSGIGSFRALSGRRDVGALLGLVFGCGSLLIWRSGPRAPRRRAATTRTWIVRCSDLLRQAGVDGVGPPQLLGLQVLGAGVVGAIVLGMTATVAVAACFALFGFFGPIMVLHGMRRRRQVALREFWPEAVDNLRSAVRAGLSLPEGLSALALRGPEPLRPAFARFSAAYRASGRFGECLDALKDDLGDPVGDRVCETMRLAREVGGSDLGTSLVEIPTVDVAWGHTRA